MNSQTGISESEKVTKSIMPTPEENPKMNFQDVIDEAKAEKCDKKSITPEEDLSKIDKTDKYEGY